MHALASLLMIAVTASWIAARQCRQHQGDGLEWALLSVLPATAALLLFLESGSTETALRLWLGHLALALLALAAWSLRAGAALQRPAWTMVSVSVLAAGLLWNSASAPAEHRATCDGESCGFGDENIVWRPSRASAEHLETLRCFAKSS